MNKKPFLVPAPMKDKYTEITDLINAFCDKELNDDYKEFCSKLCASLCRKRPSPLLKGRTNTWACSIIHAIGTVNFLFDKTLTPHMKVVDLSKAFGISPSTCSSRSKEIQEMMDIYFFSPEWTFKKTLEDMPFNSVLDGGTALDNFFSLFDGLLDDAQKLGLTPEDLNTMLAEEFSLDEEQLEPEEAYKTGNVINLQVARENSRKNHTRSRKQEAEELIDIAFQLEDLSARKDYAIRALSLYKDCTYAYLILAQCAESIAEAKKYYELAVDAGKTEIGELSFKKHAGQFWLYPPSRPFMNAKLGLAETLWLSGEKEEAINHLQEMMILNPNDNQGVRYLLINMLLAVDDYETFDKLYNDFPDDIYSGMFYARALYFYKLNNPKQGEKLLKKALKANPHVVKLLIGQEKMPDVLPDLMGVGDFDEAVIYCADASAVWRGVNGAIEWLKEVYFKVKK